MSETRKLRALVRRPWLVALLAAVCLGAGAAAALGLAGMSGVLARQPITIVQGAEELAAALEAAPWIELSAGEGEAVWALAPPACAACPDFYARQLPAIQAQGALVRVIIALPRADNDAVRAAWTAELAKTRDATLLAPLMTNAHAPAVAQSDPAEREGHLEWGRAAQDRIGAIIGLNGRDLEAPALFWKRGVEWRALTNADANAAAYVRRDL